MNPILRPLRILLPVVAFACQVPLGLHAELQLLDPTQPYAGRSHASWAEAWTRWLLSIPAGANHPRTERTGVAQGQEQAGPVWFLTGPPREQAAPTRHVLVPEGKIIFVPIDGIPAVNRLPVDSQTVRFLNLQYEQRLTYALECRLDGVPFTGLSAYDVRTPIYSNVVIAAVPPTPSFPGTPAEMAGPGITWGTFLPIAPPAAGRHKVTLSWRGVGQAAGTVTYEFEVIPGLPQVAAFHDRSTPGRIALRWPIGARHFALERSKGGLTGGWEAVPGELQTNETGIGLALDAARDIDLLRLVRPKGAGRVAYDPFEMAIEGNDESLLNNGGGSGFLGGWRQGGFNVTGSVNFRVEPESLQTGLPAGVGGRVRSGLSGSIVGVQRNLVQALRGGTAAPEVTYLSFRVRPEGVVGAGAFNGFFGLTLNEDLFIGKPGGGSLNNWVMEQRGGENQMPTTHTIAVGRTDLLVLKMDFRTPRRIFLWVNPPEGTLEPAKADAVHTALPAVVTKLGIYSTGAFSLDEICVGEAFADVAPPRPR